MKPQDTKTKYIYLPDPRFSGLRYTVPLRVSLFLPGLSPDKLTIESVCSPGLVCQGTVQRDGDREQPNSQYWFVKLNTGLNWLLALLFIYLLIACQSPNQYDQTPIRPNILFIVTDDQAPWGTGITGNTQLKTPVLDGLARQGARFTNFFTPTPVCSPSGASLMTSRYGTEVGITDWINHYWEGTPKGPEPDLGLDTKYPTWAER